MEFNREEFNVAFVKALGKLARAEKVTRETLKDLSREILTAIHATGDIGYANRLLPVLTPVNKKVAILFLKHFTGFRFDDESLLFTKKNQKKYDEAHAAHVVFLEDPNNNIWSWAERHIDVEEKPFDVKTVTSTIIKAIKKTNDQKAVMKAVLAGGITVDTIIALMQEMDEFVVEVKVEG